ncbi:hypothetical protein [Caudovirales GX15bay]|nr:hypothetical protein [Caudovirales GX15bay]
MKVAVLAVAAWCALSAVFVYGWARRWWGVGPRSVTVFVGVTKDGSGWRVASDTDGALIVHSAVYATEQEAVDAAWRLRAELERRYRRVGFRGTDEDEAPPMDR